MEQEEKTNSEIDTEQKNMPRGISEKDYADFLDLLDRLNVSEEESLEDDMENGGEEDEKGGINDGRKEGKKKVQFAKGTVIHSAVGKKTILRNRNERSPINAEELQKMCKRDFVEFRPTSKEILSDFVLEKSVEINREIKKAAERRKTKKWRTMSEWKSRKMGLPDSDEEGF